MSNALFFRLLSSDDKAAALAQALDALDAGHAPPGVVHSADASSFAQLPGSPIAYWVSDAMRDIFTCLPKLEGNAANVRTGLSTKDDFRFVRCYWEEETTHQRPSWIPLAKGGEMSPYYADIRSVVNWRANGEEIKTFLIDLATHKYGVASASKWIYNVDYYFRSGLTFPRRTKRFAPAAMPPGSIFSVAGQAIFSIPPDPAALGTLLGVTNTRLFHFLIQLRLARGDIEPQYEVGTIQDIPYAPIGNAETAYRLSDLALRCHDLRRDDDRGDETTHAFTAPALLLGAGATLAARMEAALVSAGERAAAVALHSYEIDRLVLDLYGVSPGDRAAIDEELKPHPGSYPGDAAQLDAARFRQAYLTKEEVADEYEDENAESASSEGASARAKKRRARYRDWEELAHLFRLHPAAIARRRAELGLLRSDELAAEVESLLSYCLGVVLGRWDARIGKNPALATTLGGAFDALPVCAPGALTEDAAQLTDAPLPYRPERLPAGPGDLPADYPVAVQWSGLLVDDPDHPDDVVRRVQEVLAYLWGERAEAIEQEACTILGIKGLREYLRRPAAFFATHLARYSKSRRQAPLYWPLSTASGSYTLWLYYPRLTSDTLYTAINRYLEPKMAQLGRDLGELEEKLRAASGREATRLREEMEDARASLAELTELRAELLRVAALPYRPDLNDGVIINAAPLHRLFRLPRWAKDTRATWEKLERGEYDWAHLAYAIWPDRVREKCRSDRSLAIAHELEELYVGPGASAGRRA